MNLEFAIPAKNITIVNPHGTVAICRLWTKPESVVEKLRQEAPHLLEANSPLALIGGLYGGGLKDMLRNLLYNPQIDSILVYGPDYSGVSQHLKAFFQGKVERTGEQQVYVFEDGHEEELERVAIIGDDSKYFMDDLLLPEMFQHPPAIIDNLPFDSTTMAPISDWFQSYYSPDPVERERIFIPLPTPLIETFPSDMAAHVIVEDTIFKAWLKLLFRLSRFGKRVVLRKNSEGFAKKRNELLNVKVVIHNPEAYSDEDLKHFNISANEVEKYQNDLLNPNCPDAGQLTYTYGSRLGSHFGVNMLEKVAADLCLDGDSRHNVATLWDNGLDIQNGDPPCLLSLFFRKIEERVHLTVTFRSHNATRAWPRNCLGLVAVMRYVCNMANINPDKTEPHQLKPGILTVFSQSISIDPGDLEGASAFIEKYKNKNLGMVTDPNGYFIITLDQEAHEIVVHHCNHDNETIDEYRGESPSKITKRLYKNEAISDISHALYMGSQLERAWFCLVNGREYLQDKTKIYINKSA